MGRIGLILFLFFGILAMSSRFSPALAADGVPERRWFDVPEGESIFVSATSEVSVEDALDPDLRVRVDRRSVFSVKQTVPGIAPKEGGTKERVPFYMGDVEFYDENGRKKLIENVYVPARDMRETPLEGAELKVTSLEMKAGPRATDPCPPPEGPAQAFQQSSDMVAANFRFGQCLETPAKPETNLFRQTVGKVCNELWASHGVNASHHGKRVDASHACAIDALARTIYGEMRGCMRKGLRYPLAVARVAMNRVEDVRQHGLYDAFVDSRSEGARAAVMKTRDYFLGAPVAFVVPHLMESKEQFSAWNWGDSNNEAVLCPKLDSSEWQAALDVATAAVYQDPEFLEQTKGVKTRHYTSGMKGPWKDAKEITGTRVGGMPVDDPKCLRLWKVPEPGAASKTKPKPTSKAKR